MGGFRDMNFPGTAVGMQMLLAAAGERPRLQSFPDSAPWSGGAHGGGCHAPPASPGQAHAGSAPVCILTGGEDSLARYCRRGLLGPAIWVSLGACSKAECSRPHLRARDSVPGQVGIQIRTIEGSPWGPVIRTPRSPAAKDLGQSLRSEN